MFTKTAQFYDKFYASKDYHAEVEKLNQILAPLLTPGRHTLLDVACGTGRHLEFLQESYHVEGLDLNAELLDMARQRLPEVEFHQGDMQCFDLKRRFDVVTCLFSSIGYLKTIDRVEETCRCMAQHLNPGGVLVIEPWFPPEDWHPGGVYVTMIEEPGLKLCRMNTSLSEGRLSYFDFHYLVGTPEGTQHFIERHELGLFELSEMRAAVESAGLAASYDAQGLTGRGLWVGKKPDG
jgi:ubiquinone/menaquinone biosynthesis C-methylase UbiE